MIKEKLNSIAVEICISMTKILCRTSAKKVKMVFTVSRTVSSVVSVDNCGAGWTVYQMSLYTLAMPHFPLFLMHTCKSTDFRIFIEMWLWYFLRIDARVMMKYQITKTCKLMEFDQLISAICSFPDHKQRARWKVEQLGH